MVSVGYEKDKDKKKEKRRKRRILAGDVGVLGGADVGSGVCLSVPISNYILQESW